MGRRIAVHQTAIVAPEVELGDDTIVGPFAVILAPCRIGRDCWIGPHVVIGTTAEHLMKMTVARVPTAVGAADDDADRRRVDEQVWFGRHGGGVEIGDGTTIREHATLQQGTEGPTRLGSELFVQSQSYIAHDVTIEDRARISPMASLGGHAWVGHDANIGMASSVHQHRAVGAGAMVGMHATVVRDVPPFALVTGTPARVSSVNRIVMERLGFDEATIAALTAAFEAHDFDHTPAPALAPDFDAWRARATPA